MYNFKLNIPFYKVIVQCPITIKKKKSILSTHPAKNCEIRIDELININRNNLNQNSRQFQSNPMINGQGLDNLYYYITTGRSSTIVD